VAARVGEGGEGVRGRPGVAVGGGWRRAVRRGATKQHRPWVAEGGSMAGGDGGGD
jgi:hypothetical protein